MGSLLHFKNRLLIIRHLRRPLVSQYAHFNKHHHPTDFSPNSTECFSYEKHKMLQSAEEDKH